MFLIPLVYFVLVKKIKILFLETKDFNKIRRTLSIGNTCYQKSDCNIKLGLDCVNYVCSCNPTDDYYWSERNGCGKKILFFINKLVQY